MTLWQKGTRAEDWVTRFTVGEDYRWDTLLLKHDIDGTSAHAWALSTIGLLSEVELRQIDESLGTLRKKVEAGEIEVRVEDEDAHTVIETHLTEHLGDTGKKIHAGRSRNDQVLVALRLFTREMLRATAETMLSVVDRTVSLAERYDHIIIPGYTHMQRAMPSTVGLWAMGYAELLCNDLDMVKAAHDQNNVSPWGSAAGYGVPFLRLPRDQVADRLGFRDVQMHVTAVQLSRGKLELAVVHALVQVAATINRLCSDLVLYNTSEFGFVKLPARFCTGSSIMPQKQNPDVLELARASYHRIIAEMQLLQTLPANLPSGYHRDLQLTKESVMRALLLTQDLVTAINELIPGIEFDETRMGTASSPDLFATHRALDLVGQGIPFREAYRQAASEVDALSAMGREEALASYQVEGYPGHINRAKIHQLLERHRKW